MLSQELTGKLWHGKHPLSHLLAPLGWLYQLFMSVRHLAYHYGLIPVQRVSVPVIVVGNITVGGSGKTPLVIWLADFLKQKKFHPGIITNGYGGAATHWPQQVRADSDPAMVGDESVLIARRTGCPVAASPHRYAAAQGLTEFQQCDIIICDDGLQHLALMRDIEIVVVDGVHRYGNRRCLPAGPLRESLRRLKTVDMVVCNGSPQHHEYQMEYVPGRLTSLADQYKKCDIEKFRSKTVHAVAGIAHPDRFFNLLRSMGIDIIEHTYPDHHHFTATDIRFDDGLPVIMTEKDAVKCIDMARDEHWYLPVDARMTDAFRHRLSMLLKDIINGQETA